VLAVILALLSGPLVALQLRDMAGWIELVRVLFSYVFGSRADVEHDFDVEVDVLIGVAVMVSASVLIVVCRQLRKTAVPNPTPVVGPDATR
jgi:hypothetical protein